MRLSVREIRWGHIWLSIPATGYIHGPVVQIPNAAAVIWVFFPIIVLSGFWLCKGYWLKRNSKI
ncbi:hypothetical protein DIU36_00565 [Mucilaginibacter rubeus]|nr:hypothetical protein DIU36_00565 [Mucilaginibacter rubeus]